MVLAIPGLITFYALSLTLPFLLMSLLNTLTVVCLITTHCIFHLISTLFHFLVLLIKNVSNCDIDKYISLVSQGISTFPSDVYNCIIPGCTLHCDTLDLYADHLVSTLITCALDSFPTRSVSSSRRLVGWNRSLSKLKNATNFSYKIWEEAGFPNAGVLFQIKRNGKRRYKYEVRRLVHRQKYICCKINWPLPLRKSVRTLFGLMSGSSIVPPAP